jgi:hypothetical protein
MCLRSEYQQVLLVGEALKCYNSCDRDDPWLYSVPPSKRWNSASTKPLPFPSKSFQIPQVFTILYRIWISHSGSYEELYLLGYNVVYCLTLVSRDSSVGIATRYGLEDREYRSSSPSRVKNFLFCTSSRPALGSTHPPIQWVPGAVSVGVQRPGRETDNSPPTSAEVKKMWIYTSTPPYVFMA